MGKSSSDPRRTERLKTFTGKLTGSTLVQRATYLNSGNSKKSLSVLTPVGPGHEQSVLRCTASVALAAKTCPLEFSRLEHLIFDDTQGEHGRAAARNMLQAAADTDWLLWMDADDHLHLTALRACLNNMPGWDGMWGECNSVGHGETGSRDGQTWPFTWETLVGTNPWFGLQMGYCIKTEIQQQHLWKEQAAEDYEMYLRLWHHHKCIKVREPLTVRDRSIRSTGPKAVEVKEWVEVSQSLQSEWKLRTNS